MWQRVIRTDRAALYSDRIAADASWRALGGSADFSLAWDITALEVNDARLQFARPFSNGFAASLEGRRFRPFFEAWTIWGAFSPVAFNEVRVEVSWRNQPGFLSVDARGAWRRYDETNAGLESTPLKDGGWRAGAGVEWTPREHWLTYADYDVDIGFGASRSDIVGGARWMPDESKWFGIAASGLQHIYEFRIGTGRIIGVRAEGGARITPEVRARGGRRALLASSHERCSGARLEPAQVHGAVRLDGRWRSGTVGGKQAVRRLLLAVIALATLAPVAKAQRGPNRPFPHERHERLFPLCESCHAGIPTGDAATSMPTEASCRECHNGTDARVVTWRRPAKGQGLLHFSHPAHAREVDSTGKACATCHGTSGQSRMTVSRAQPPSCLGCHTHRASEHLADDNRCSTCHVALTAATALSAERIMALPKPPSHERTDFVAAHLPGTPLASTSCATCHARESCARCHVNASTQPIIAALGSDARVAATRGWARPVVPGADRPSRRWIRSEPWCCGENERQPMRRMSRTTGLHDVPPRLRRVRRAESDARAGTWRCAGRAIATAAGTRANSGATHANRPGHSPRQTDARSRA